MLVTSTEKQNNMFLMLQKTKDISFERYYFKVVFYIEETVYFPMYCIFYYIKQFKQNFTKGTYINF